MERKKEWPHACVGLLFLLGCFYSKERAMSYEDDCPSDSQRERMIQSAARRYECDFDTAERYVDLKIEGYSNYQAMLLAGLADPHGDE
jgi:hypothetical protein